MELLKNAVKSLQIGICDFRVGTHPRLLSAVRNIHAGILLLYKEKLRRLSPKNSEEVLVKHFIVPVTKKGQKIVFQGRGKKTVDAQEIRVRFDSLGVKTDWERFKKINDIRNEIEHYYTKSATSKIKQLVSETFVITRDFIITELKRDPVKLLGKTAWETMLKTQEVFEKEKKECNELIESIDWESITLEEGIKDLTCKECGEPLLRPEPQNVSYEQIALKCRSCGKAEEAESFVSRAIADALEFDYYLMHTDGAELPYVTCPECSAETYVIKEERCALCGYEAEHTCSMCCSRILPEELGTSPLCGWCAHLMSKRD